MKTRWIAGLLIVGSLGTAGTVLLFRNVPKQEPSPEAARPVAIKQPVERPSVKSEQAERTQPPPAQPAPEPVVITQTETAADGDVPPETRAVENPPASRPSLEEQQIAAQKRYWDNIQRQFEQLRMQLEREQDPEKRRWLIQQMSQHVQVNTVATLNWSATLDDKEEKRIAMEAISKNALVGVGARIQQDGSGFPSIQQTTELSAVGSTGLVKPGDYIIGMNNADGESVYFEGMPLSEVVQHLRGQPGTEINLFMQRMPEYGGSTPLMFEVPVTRSMIIVQPPF